MLRATRQALGLTQIELAKRAKVSQAYVASIEAGSKQNPSMAVLYRLARVLSVPVADLIPSRRRRESGGLLKSIEVLSLVSKDGKWRPEVRVCVYDEGGTRMTVHQVDVPRSLLLDSQERSDQAGFELGRRWLARDRRRETK
jgi:transcriptional regulator with XRE-family HTH domain